MVLCPVCGNKTRVKICGDTEFKNSPLFCPECKNEMLIKYRTHSKSCNEADIPNALDRQFDGQEQYGVVVSDLTYICPANC